MQSFPFSVRLAPEALFLPRFVYIGKMPSESVDHHLRQQALIAGMSRYDCVRQRIDCLDASLATSQSPRSLGPVAALSAGRESAPHQTWTG
jgi:hypothetical protein